LNRTSAWAEAPENATPAAYEQCRRVIADLVEAAGKSGAVLAIEPYWRNVIDGAERAERLFRDIHSPALGLVMDPANYYRPEDLAHVDPMLEDVFKRVGRHALIAHAKDVKASADGTDLPAAGLGVLDYPLYLRLLASLGREMFLTLEHLKLEDVPRARDYVLGQFEKI
jgi:sugar phosphate isomerase/epimerase